MTATPDPVAVLGRIHADAEVLDTISKRLYEANERLDAAESGWLVVYDAIAESLKDEMVSEGRKGDPSEHWITSVARRQHRVVYQEWRNADRAAKRLAQQLKAKTAAMSGRQSELKVLQAEGDFQGYAGQRRHAA
jgi:hypothetical protein